MLGVKAAQVVRAVKTVKTAETKTVAETAVLTDIHRQIKAELSGLEPGKTTKEIEMMLLQKYGVILPQLTPEEQEAIDSL